MSPTALSVVTDPATEPDTVAAGASEHLTPTTEPTAVEPPAIIEDQVAVPPHAEAKYLDPAELLIAENVRKSFDLADHPEQVATIEQFGVRVPVLAEREPDGSILVYEGQVRTLIARHLGLARIPVWVTDAATDLDPAERRIVRTLDQININERRIPTPASDQAAGIALTLKLGASATRVAKATQRKPAEVRKIAAVGKSATAKRLLDDNQYSLDQLAVIAHYENLGDTDAVQQLLAVSRYQLDWTAKRISAERAETRDRLQASLVYAAYGFAILTRQPDTSTSEPTYLPAEEIATATGDPVTTEAIYADPDRWAVFLELDRDAEIIDIDTGELVDPDTVDWTTRGDCAAEPGDGLRHAETVTRRDRWTPLYYLPADQLADSGLQRRVDTVDTSDEQAVAAAEAAAAERERARQDRRRVIELNKRGEDSHQRRNDFLVTLVSGARPPAQTAGFVAEALARGLDPAVLHKVTSLLRIDGSTDKLVEAIHAASPNRAWMIVLAMQLAAHEIEVGKSFWRDGGARTRRYMRFLGEVGAERDFALADVEQAAAGDIDYHDIDID
ncbi:ParB N-terminal domain-containing protein [Nocardia xishanensis]|uniref:ParB/RepB/Spo0J family partition protein n=1 Tax=Nocardia xishanensis TaxID=238964 RepID=UPI0033DFF972